MIDRRLVTLASGIFVNSCGIIMTFGMLNDLSENLGMSVAALGQLSTVSSLVVAFGAPVFAVLTSNVQRRDVLVTAMALASAGALLAAFSPSFTLLTIGRILTGVAVALYTPQAASTAALLYPPEQRGHAVAAVMLGMSLANVAGIPLGTWLGSVLGWRATMLVIGLIALTVAILTAFQIPRNLQRATIDRRSWGKIGRDKAMVAVLAFTVISGAGQMMLLSYIAPVLRDLLAAPTTTIAMLLAVYGGAGVLGNVAAARFLDRIGPFRSVVVSTGFTLTAMIVLAFSRDSLAMAVLALALWGIGSFSVGPGQQTRLMNLNPALATVSIGFNTAGFYAGMAFGSLLGGAIIATLGIGSVNIAAIGLLVVAYGVLLLGARVGARS